MRAPWRYEPFRGCYVETRLMSGSLYPGNKAVFAVRERKPSYFQASYLGNKRFSMFRTKTSFFLGYKTGEVRRFSNGRTKTALFTGDKSQVIRRFSRGSFEKKTALFQVFYTSEIRRFSVVGRQYESPTPSDLGFWKHSWCKGPRYCGRRD